jgi:hypothetical protein
VAGATDAAGDPVIEALGVTVVDELEQAARPKPRAAITTARNFLDEDTR